MGAAKLDNILASLARAANQVGIATVDIFPELAQDFGGHIELLTASSQMNVWTTTPLFQPFGALLTAEREGSPAANTVSSEVIRESLLASDYKPGGSDSLATSFEFWDYVGDSDLAAILAAGDD